MALLAEQVHLVAEAHQRLDQPGVVDVGAGSAEQIAVEDQDAHGRSAYPRPDAVPGKAAGRRGRVRTSTPSARVPGHDFTTALPPAQPLHGARGPAGGRAEARSTATATRARRSRSSARCCRWRPRSPGSPGRPRTCASAPGAGRCPRGISTTARPAAGGWVRWGSGPERADPVRLTRGRAALAACAVRALRPDAGGLRRQQRLRRGTQDDARTHAADRHERRKGRRNAADDRDDENLDDENRHDRQRRILRIGIEHRKTGRIRSGRLGQPGNRVGRHGQRRKSRRKKT